MRGDMAPRQDRSIRNIPVSSIHKKRPVRYESEEVAEPVRAPRRRKRGGGRLLILGIAVAVIFGILGLLLSTLFAGASVVVYPRTAAVTDTAQLFAQPNAPAGTLSYQTLTMSVSGTTSVSASGSQKVSRQASGVITITNAYNGETQRLIANTRFEAPDGKIYRIHESVVVPGMQGTTPGTAKVTVYADVAGAEYNRGATHFTVPGFKNDPRYSKFYADADSISGGFVGNEPAVAQADLDSAKAAMAQKLSESASNSIRQQVPEGFAIVENTAQSTYSDMRQTPEGSNSAALSQTLTTTVAAVRLSDLAAYTASKTVEGYAGEAVTFDDPTSVKITAATGTKPVGKIDFTVSGTKSIVWVYDPEAVKTALLGKNKANFETIISSFRPALTGAEVTLRPFWASQFPAEPSKIKVTEGAKK